MAILRDAARSFAGMRPSSTDRLDSIERSFDNGAAFL